MWETITSNFKERTWNVLKIFSLKRRKVFETQAYVMSHQLIYGFYNSIHTIRKRLEIAEWSLPQCQMKIWFKDACMLHAIFVIYFQ